MGYYERNWLPMIKSCIKVKTIIEKMHFAFVIMVDGKNIKFKFICGLCLVNGYCNESQSENPN